MVWRTAAACFGEKVQPPISGLTGHLLDPAEGAEVTGGGGLLEQLRGRHKERGRGRKRVSCVETKNSSVSTRCYAEKLKVVMSGLAALFWAFSFSFFGLDE